MSIAAMESVLKLVEDVTEEMVEFAAALVRIPTVNPPGELYGECAERIGNRLRRLGFEVEYHRAEGRPEHTRENPRVNVIGVRRGRHERPLVHLNGHMDVVPGGGGWTVDPFAGLVREGRLYGRGSSDMKAGIAAAVYAAEAIRRAGVDLEGTVELSATVDEESGGFAGVAWLAERGRIASGRTDYVIIAEPFNGDRICVGHRGAYWFQVTAAGKTAHGSMPFLGVNAIDQMGALLEAIRTELSPALAGRTTRMPVVPAEARRATININAISGGQAGQDPQTPCVADRCTAIFDRRFLMEEGFEATRAEIVELLQRVSDRAPGRHFELADVAVFLPVVTPEDSPVIKALEKAVRVVVGRPATLVASPGTYDHKHVAAIAGIADCAAYGPGILELAHQPDEFCKIEDLVIATKVLALAILELAGVGASPAQPGEQRGVGE